MTNDRTSYPSVSPGLPAVPAAPEPLPLESSVEVLVALPSTAGVPAQAARPIEEVADPQFTDFETTDVGRDLDPEELRRMAAAVAARPELWQEHLAFDDDHRHYASLYRDSHIDVWMLCWTPRNDTGWHDHDISSGAVAVVSGTLVEHNLAIGRASQETEIEGGNVFCFGPEHIHRLTGGTESAVSIHVYSPPLWRMGQYAIDNAGILRRVSVSYADELRPIDP